MSTAIGLALVGVVAYRVDGLWSRSIGGGGGYGSDASSLVLSDRTNPASFVWGSLLRPYRYDWIGREFVIAATVLVVLAALAIRIAPRRPVVPWALSTVAAVLWIIDLVTVREVATTMITGLFPAFPLLLAALVLVGRQDLRSRDTSIAGATFVLGAAALVLTSYGSGGSTEWGGRYLNVFLVPLVGPAMTIVLRRRPVFSESELRLLGVPLAVLLLALPVAAVAWVGGRARQIGPQMKRLEITATAESGAPSRPLAIVWRSSADGMSRRLWVVRDRIDALHLNEFRMLAGLLNRAAAAGHRVVVLVSDVPLAVFPLLATPTLDDARWKLDEGASWADGDIAVFVLRIGSPEAERENPLDG